MQLLLNDPGTLSMRIFNRQNDMQQIIGDRQGYTQGVGLSYEVDFNTTGELLRKIFGKQNTEKQRVVPVDSVQLIQPNDSLISGDTLIRFIPKNKKPF